MARVSTRLPKQFKCLRAWHLGSKIMNHVFFFFFFSDRCANQSPLVDGKLAEFPGVLVQ